MQNGNSICVFHSNEKHGIVPKIIWILKRDVLCSHYTRLDEAFNNSLGVYTTTARNQNGWKMHKTFFVVARLILS